MFSLIENGFIGEPRKMITSSHTVRYITSSIKVIVPTERELSLMIFDKLNQFESETSKHTKNVHSLSSNDNMEYLELKGMMSKQIGMLKMLIPKQATISFLAENTGKSRQAIRQFLIKNFDPEEDFWTKGGKMYVSQDTAVAVLMRSIK